MGQVMGEQAREGGGGGTPSAMGLHPRGAFEERPPIIQACGDAGAIQARRAPCRFSMREGQAAQEQMRRGAWPRASLAFDPVTCPKLVRACPPFSPDHVSLPREHAGG